MASAISRAAPEQAQAAHGPLHGLRVLDLTHYIAGPFCTKLLADYGADVIKIERPGRGDGMRHVGPFLNDAPNPEKAGPFLYLNTNKFGVTLNLKQYEGRQLFLEMLKSADVVVENFSPGTLESSSLHYEELRKTTPDLVMTSISNFGQTGPYRDFKANELIEYGMGGQLRSTGYPDRPPVKLGGNVGIYQAGQNATFATVTALFRRELDGFGDYLDVSLFETQASNQDRRSIYMLNHEYTGAITKRHSDATGLAFGIFPCADGYICFWSGVNRFSRVAEMVGRPELMNDPRFADYERGVSDDAIHYFNNDVLLPWTLERDLYTVWRESQKCGLATAPVMSPGQFFADPYYRARGFFPTIDHPKAGKLDYPGRPFIMQNSPWKLRRPAPLLGQHNQEIYGGMLGLSTKEIADLRKGGII